MRLFATTSALFALAAAAAGAPASAGTTTPIPVAPINGPVVAAGGEAFWAAPHPDFEGFDLLATKPGGPVRTVSRFPSYETPDGHQVSLIPQLSAAGPRIGLAVDAEPIAVSRYEDYLDPAGADVLSGPVDAPLEPLLDCRPGTSYGVTVAVSEHATVFPGPDCDAARAGGLALRSAGDGQSTPLTPYGIRPRAAGSFVGWIGRNGGIVVYDTSGASVAYTIPASPETQIADWDLQADGKVALASAPDRSHPATLSWYSPADPTPHPLGLPAAASWDVHFAGDRIAVLHSQGRDRGSGYYFGELEVIGLDGGAARTLSRRAIGIQSSHSLLGFDGATIAWTTPACSGALLHSQAVGEPPPKLEGPRPRCPLSLRSRPKLLDKRSIRVRLRCSGFVLPHCGGSQVRLDAVKQHVKLGSDQSRFCAPTADVYLTRRGRALVRTHRKLRVRVTTTTTDTGGTREVRSTAFTLRTRERIHDASTCEDDY